MLQDYIQRQLRAKNQSIYFKKGKWIFQVLCIATLWLSAYLRMKPPAALAGGAASTPPAGAVWASLLSVTPFLAFFYFYCLYLIPVCFKQARYRRFWTILLVLLALMPWVEAGVQTGLLQDYPLLRSAHFATGWHFVQKMYQDFVMAFLGFTVILFLMELVEGIRTFKETDLSSNMLSQTEVQLLKTKMNPAFMTRSLDAIIALSEAKSGQAPDAVVQFSDVLRYRLYRSRQPQVPLGEELQQLDHLFRLQNALPAGAATLDVEGENQQAMLTPLLLLNLAELLLTVLRADAAGTLLFYILIEEEALQIAVELITTEPAAAVMAQLQNIYEETSKMAGTTLNFDTEHTQNNFSIRLCLPLQIASSTV